jgi:transposase
MRYVGIGPAIAATAIGDVRDISRFPSRNHFAAYNGTAPTEVPSGNRVIYRLSLRGNRRLNHASMPHTVRPAGRAISPAASSANVVNVGAVKHGRKSSSGSLSKPGSL